jgi:hypothetical protein
VVFSHSSNQHVGQMNQCRFNVLLDIYTEKVMKLIAPSQGGNIKSELYKEGSYQEASGYKRT